MSYVDGTVYSHERVTFWTRPHALVFAWPVLLALLLLLLLAGLIAVGHYCASQQLWAPRVRPLPAVQRDSAAVLPQRAA